MDTIKKKKNDNITTTPEEFRKIAIYSTGDGIFATMWTVASLDVLLATFYTRLGFSPFLMGIIGLIPYLAYFLQFTLFKWIQSVDRKRKYVVLTSFFARFAWLFVTFVPFLPAELDTDIFYIPYFRNIIFLSLVALTWFSMTTCGLLWSSWMSDSIPVEKRGKFFGIRSSILQLTRVIVFFITGMFLGDDPSLTFEYPIMFFVSTLLGFVATFMVSRQPTMERKLPEKSREPLFSEKFGNVLKLAIRDKGYIFFLIFVIVWYFMNVLPGPFWIPFCIKYIDMHEQQITYMMMISTLSTMIFFYLWGLVIEKFSNRPVLIVTCIGSSFIPYFYVLASNNVLGLTYEWMYIEEGIAGIMNSGISLTIFNYAISFGKPKNRNIYLTLYYVVAGACGTVAAFSSGIIVEFIDDFSFLGLNFYGMTVMILLASLGRIACVFIASNLGERGSTHKMWYSLYRLILDRLNRR